MACARRVHGVCMARTLYAHRMHTACTPHARCVCRSSSGSATTPTPTLPLTLALTPKQEFIRIGYYVNTEYDAPELMEAPPEQILYERLVRNILVDKPRVTRYQIDWADNSAAAGAMAEATTETPATAGATEQSGSFDSMHSAMGMPMADESMAVEAPMVMAE